MYEVWYGTPNEMGKAASKATQPAAVKWARDHLSGMERQAEKYDRAAINEIRRVKDELGQTASLTDNGMRGWQFPYITVTFRLELRKT